MFWIVWVFGETWCKWIQFCISIVQLSILVNGTPTGFFPTFPGLCQGDLLSPFVYFSDRGIGQITG